MPFILARLWETAGPLGGVCSGAGRITAVPGYWGAAVPPDNTTDATDAAVAFIRCPDGYCCDSAGSCTSIASCAANRGGPLCGDCAAGFVQGVGAVACVPLQHCDTDVRVVVTLLVVGVFCAAAIQLFAVSDVWLPSRSHPVGKLKLAIYFLQVMGVCVDVGVCVCARGMNLGMV